MISQQFLNKVKMQQQKQSKIMIKSIHSNISKDSKGQPLHQIAFTPEEDDIYGHMLQSWKINQRNSLPRKQYANYSNIYTQNPDDNTHSSIQDQRSNIFYKYTPQILNYLKAKFVLEELIEQLEQQRFLDLTDHTVIEFLHLLSFRAWCDINATLNTFAFIKDKKDEPKINGNSSQFVSRSEEESLKILITPMFKLGQKIEKVFLLYHKSLSFRQKSFRYRFKSAINFIFHNAQKTSRDKILFGIQGKDFTRDQQIKYTQEQMIPIIRKKLIQYAGTKPLKMRDALLGYPKIMKIQIHKLNGFDDFQVVKKTLIKEQQSKYKLKPTFM